MFTDIASMESASEIVAQTAKPPAKFPKAHDLHQAMQEALLQSKTKN